MSKCLSILMVGAEQGVGVTSTISNLASMLSKRGKVLLIDMDDNSSEGLDEYFDFATKVKTFKDIEDKISYGANIIESYLNVGFENISLIKKQNGANEEALKRTANLLKKSFDFIMIDAGFSGDESLKTLLSIAGKLFLVMAPNADSVSLAKKKYRFFHKEGVNSSKINWIVNKFGKDRCYDVESLRSVLNGSSELFILSNDDRDEKPLFEAKPFLFQDCSSGYASDLSELVSYMVNSDDNSLINKSSDGQDESSVHRDDPEMKRFLLDKLFTSKEMKDVLISTNHNQTEFLKKKVAEIVSQILDEHIVDVFDRESLIDDVVTASVGLGILEKFMRDETVTEIMVLSKDEIYTERGGLLCREKERFSSDNEVVGLIERIIAPVNRRVDESSPYVDARLHDGSRVHVIIPPLSLKGPSITIRKFARKICDVEALIANETLSQEMVDVLISSVEAKANILVSGGTGSGKTTMLNILSGYVPENERIVTIEDSAELRLKQPHVVSLESRPPNIEGEGEVTIRDLVRTSLRMRPDRIVVGECRGAEALDMLQAMNTGHSGSLTTLHANTARDSLMRLETLVMYAGFKLPILAIRRQIASAIDIVVHLSRMRNGERKVVAISEITGMDGDIISMNDLFIYESGCFVSSGFKPKCLELM